MVAAELAQQSTLEAAAQSVVERVKRLHHDAFVSGRQRASHCSRHEDMTLLVRLINYPLPDGTLTPTQGEAPFAMSQHPQPVSPSACLTLKCCCFSNQLYNYYNKYSICFPLIYITFQDYNIH